MKTITIIAKEWFDRINGNSYFSARIFPDNETSEPIILPMQYGYGDQYIYESRDKMIEAGILPADAKDENLTRYCRENQINLIYTKHENYLKRDVKWYGEE